MNKPGNKTEQIYMRITPKNKKFMVSEAKRCSTPDRAGTLSEALDRLIEDAVKWRESQKSKAS